MEFNEGRKFLANGVKQPNGPVVMRHEQHRPVRTEREGANPLVKRAEGSELGDREIRQSQRPVAPAAGKAASVGRYGDGHDFVAVTRKFGSLAKSGEFPNAYS